MLEPAAPSPALDPDRTELPALGPEAVAGALHLHDWLLGEGARADDAAHFLAGLAERLIALGVPVDRLSTAIDTLHSEYSGIGRVWTRGQGPSFRLFPHGEVSEAAYARSPFATVHASGEWLVLDLDAVAPDRYAILAELRAEGYRHYLTIPLFFSNGTRNGLSMATRAPAGFDADAVALLRFLMPTISAVTEMRGLNARLDNVLKIYVGDGPHREILSGAIRRGQVLRIRSAILFADMRGYTRLSAVLAPEAAVELLNAYFDCLVPPIEAEGGEVLKYMGDGVLAIFRESGDDLGGAAQSALTAAEQALARIDEANRAGRFATPIAAGIALHHGEAAYGNVGSGSRLDFTVIGRDVNLASRIAKLNKTLGEPLLMSRPFVEYLWGDPEPLGEHVVEGFEERIGVYRPGRPGAASL